MERRLAIQAGIAFILSYAILFGLSATALLGPWDSVMFFLLPIPGFFFGYWMTDYIEKEFSWDLKLKPWVPFAWMALAIAAFYVALLFYIQNNAWLTLKAQGNSQRLLLDSFTQSATFLNGIIWNELWKSAFLPFCIALLLGWVANSAIQKFSQ